MIFKKNKSCASVFPFAEDKCGNCDVNGKCDKGKCACNQGFVGEGTKGTCKPSKCALVFSLLSFARSFVSFPSHYFLYCFS